MSLKSVAVEQSELYLPVLLMACCGTQLAGHN